MAKVTKIFIRMGFQDDMFSHMGSYPTLEAAKEDAGEEEEIYEVVAIHATKRMTRIVKKNLADELEDED